MRGSGFSHRARRLGGGIVLRLLTAVAAAAAVILAQPPLHAQEAMRRQPLVAAEPVRKALFSKKLAELKELYAQKKFADALPLAQEVLADAEMIYGPGSREAAGSVYNLGKLYLLLDRFDMAVPTLQRAFDYERQNGSASDASYRRVMKDLIAAYKGRGTSLHPSRILGDALAELRQENVSDLATQADLLEEMAAEHRGAAMFEEAESLLSTALMVKSKLYGDMSPKLVTTLNAMAGVQKVRGRYKEAEASYNQAIAIVRQAEPSVTLAILLDNLAVLYLAMGRGSDAEPVQKEALAVAEAKLGLEHPTVAQVLANLATLYQSFNRYEEAEKLFERALSIWEGRIPATDKRFGITYDNLAGSYREQGKFELARQTYRKALANILANFPATHPEVSVALNNTGLAELAVKNVAEGKALIEKSLAITEMTLGRDHPSYAISLTNLGDALKAAGDLDGARKAYADGVDVIERTLGEKHKRTIFPLRELGRLELEQKNYRAAIRHFQRAVEAEVANRKRNPGDAGEEHRGVFTWLIDALWAAAQADEVSAKLAVQEALEVVQWTNATAAGAAIDKLGARLAAKQSDLGDLVRSYQDLTERWERIDAELLSALSKPKADREPGRELRLREQARAMRDDLLGIDKDIAARFPAYADLANPRPLTADQILAALADDEILFMYDVRTEWIDLWVVDPKADKPFTWRRISLDRDTLRKLVHKLRCGLDGGEWAETTSALKCLKAVGRKPDGGLLPFDVAAANELYRLLVGAFSDRLDGRHVVVIANDALASLPFQVLASSVGEGGGLTDVAWLGASNAVSVLPTIGSLTTLRREGAVASGERRDYLGIGNPLLTGETGGDRSAWSRTACPAGTGSVRTASLQTTSLEGMRAARAAGQAARLGADGADLAARVRRLSPLPETADEVCAVADTLGRGASRVVLGADASEAEIRRLDAAGDLARYRIVHFATHGLVAGELAGLGEPALVMTPPESVDEDLDGLLAASEVAGLRLDADWVVLSACNTAAGKGAGSEALSGLARSFFHAGARSMLVSHWPVDSASAVLLTTAAFAELRKDRSVGRAEALRRAIVSLIGDRTGPGAHPQFWAPFVVVGEGGPLGSAWVRAPEAEDTAGGQRARAAGAPLETAAIPPPRREGGVRGGGSPIAEATASTAATAGSDPATPDATVSAADGAEQASIVPVRRPQPPAGWGAGPRAQTLQRTQSVRSNQSVSQHASPTPPKPQVDWGAAYWEQVLQ